MTIHNIDIRNLECLTFTHPRPKKTLLHGLVMLVYHLDSEQFSISLEKIDFCKVAPGEIPTVKSIPSES
jgi:hypothetical protein